MSKVLVLHGPNLNLLGTREPQHYGTMTLAAIDEMLAAHAESLGVVVECRQSNHEGQLIDWIQGADAEGFGAIVLNPGGYTHTSVAIRDAVAAVSTPTIEVHLSSIYAREEFRQHSLIAPVARGQISGFGPLSYRLGLDAAISFIREGK
jgi:3-dehydroquinate dehydratase-2